MIASWLCVTMCKALLAAMTAVAVTLCSHFSVTLCSYDVVSLCRHRAAMTLLPAGVSQYIKYFLFCQAEVLQAVSDNKLGTTVKQESAHTFAAANNSLTVLRLREAKRASSK
jgi:hypothetical protein